MNAPGYLYLAANLLLSLASTLALPRGAHVLADGRALVIGAEGRALDEERTVVCATNGREGWPHLMPLWYVVRDSGPGGAAPPADGSCGCEAAGASHGRAPTLLYSLLAVALALVARTRSDSRRCAARSRARPCSRGRR